MKNVVIVVVLAIVAVLAWKVVPWGNIVARGPAQAAAAALAERFKTQERFVEVISIEKREWTDSCLGLGKPNESCLQVITPGYEIKLRAEEEDKIYRTNEDGSVVRAVN